MNESLIDKLEQVLPQTQCGLCDYDGCKPYAIAISQGKVTISRCAPGGIKTLHDLATITQQDPTPFEKEVISRSKPPQTASIRENECIGCTKCIQACPVDAIMGTAKQMHTVLKTECTGCELCVAPCPVDCIDIHPLETPQYLPALAKQRYQARNERINTRKQQKRNQHKLSRQAKLSKEIEAAVARVKAKKEAGK